MVVHGGNRKDWPPATGQPEAVLDLPSVQAGLEYGWHVVLFPPLSNWWDVDGKAVQLAGLVTLSASRLLRFVADHASIVSWDNAGNRILFSLQVHRTEQLAVNAGSV